MWKSTGMTWMPSIPICVVSDIDHLLTLRAADRVGMLLFYLGKSWTKWVWETP